MSRVDIEVRFVGPSHGSLIVAAFMGLSILTWWVLYSGLGLTQPDWLAFVIAFPATTLVGVAVGSWYEGRSSKEAE